MGRLYRGGREEPIGDLAHDRRRDHAIGVPVRQVEAARQVENVAESIEYAAENRGHLEVGDCAGRVRTRPSLMTARVSKRKPCARFGS
jgi:hypothetical protein